MLMKIYRVFIIVLLMVLNDSAFGIPLDPPVEKFITIADIHFDPFLGCDELPKPCIVLNELRTSNYQSWATILKKYENKIQIKYLQDTNYALLESSLSNLKIMSQEINPQFVLILGDFLAHNFHRRYKKLTGDKSSAGYREFVKKTMQFLTYEINKTFPEISVYPVVGNNDSYTGNYNVVPNGKFLQDTGNIWALLIKNKPAQELFLKNFSAGGYYSVTLTNKNQRLIILDTVLFSPNAQTKKVELAAQKQLAWLHDELELAKKNHQNVLLAYHIPATLDTPFTTIREFWQQSYKIEFTSIIKEFSTVIVGILPGHIHIEMFQLMDPWKNVIDIPIIPTPSISPIYGNNPSFKILSYDKNTFHISSIEAYYYSLKEIHPEWKKEYRPLPIY